MNRYTYFILVFFFLSLSQYSCRESINETTQIQVDYYTEQHRPQFHFTPEANWMNDPNGMVYLDGEYHLFYQYYPDSNVWGPMHWGHAVSTDLTYWEHMPVALYPDSLGYIFSGSAVYDRNNTSGLGKDDNGPLVAIFTHHNPKMEATSDKFQYQSIAFSNDKGRTWQKYKGNPVLENPGIRDFRDPKVIWHEASQKWIMTVAALDHVKFYNSKNLIDWKFISEFGKDIGSHEGVWECPDLFPLKTKSGKEYWILLQNMNPGNPNGGSGTQYFIGHFDGIQYEVNPNFRKLLSNIPKHVPEGKLFEDFENGYFNWEVSGNAFGNEPAKGSLPAQNQVKGYLGKALVNSFLNGDSSTGQLLSPPFTIESKYINFKIGGGNHRGRTFIALEIDGKRVRESEGKNNERLEWRGWNVEGFIGKNARIRIVDQHTEGWGHINIDHIFFSDSLAHEEISNSVWLDAGRDNYAGVTWSNAPEPETEKTFIGWMSNWAYAQTVPSYKWRSAMTIPWKLCVEEINGIPRLLAKAAVDTTLYDQVKTTLKDKTTLPENGLAYLNLKANDLTRSVGFKLMNEKGEFVHFSYDPTTNKLAFDRSKSGETSFSSDFPVVASVERIQNVSTMNIEAYMDHSSIEIFIDNGSNIFTELFFPSSIYNVVELEGLEGEMQQLKRIWE